MTETTRPARTRVRPDREEARHAPSVLRTLRSPGNGSARPVALAMAAITLIALVGTPGTGCGYHLAGKNRFLPEDMRRIAVPLFGNLTPQAEIEQRITERLVEELARRGRYETPPDPAGADAVLEGAVTSYTTRPVEFTPRGKASRVEVTVQARVTLTDLRTKRVIWNQDQFVFRGEYDVPEDETTFINEEILAIDEIARDFSRTVVTSLLEGF